MHSPQITTRPTHPPLSPASSAGFVPFVLVDYHRGGYLDNKGILIPETSASSSRSFATRRMLPIEATPTLLLLTAPGMSISPTTTESRPLPPTPPPPTRAHDRRIGLACPIFDRRTLLPPTTLLPTPPPLDLTPTQTIQPIPGTLRLRTPTTTRATATLAPIPALATTVPSSIIRSLA